MPPKKRSRENPDLQRQDNNLGFTSWPVPLLLNQKNYYTDHLKRDDQIMAFRLQAEETRNRLAKAARDKDRAMAQQSANSMAMEIDGGTVLEDATPEVETRPDLGGPPGSRVVVIHPGSQNMRIGLASDPLPKTVPMVVARRAQQSESEENGGEPRPKRRKTEGQDGQGRFEDTFVDAYSAMTGDLKARLRVKGIRFVPNTREQAMAYNRKSQPDIITEHNDINKIEWTEVPTDPKAAPDYYVGQAALRVPDRSRCRYKLQWPLRYGSFNEKDYTSKNEIYRDVVVIIEEAMKVQLGLSKRGDWKQYSCVLVVPDLYERNYVTTMLDMMFREFGFSRVCLIQESVSASFGAGYSPCCIVDVGAYKTSVCCIEDGMVVENSRIVMRYGSSDVTETFLKMLLSSDLPYADLNLRRRHDFLLAEELKQRFCTLAYSDLAHGSRQFEFHLRVPDQDTRHYRFKCYDEAMLGSMGYYRPALFDSSDKLMGRRSVIARSVDIYDGAPNDPLSSAQTQLLAIVASTTPADIVDPNNTKPVAQTDAPTTGSTPVPADATDIQAGEDISVAVATPSREGETPQPLRMSPVDGEKEAAPAAAHPLTDMLRSADQRDRTLPCIPLDQAIALSVEYAAQNDERKMRDFFGGIIPVGGGSQTNGFRQFLEEELQNSLPNFRKEVIVAPPPREIDPQVLVWKGASIFGKLQGTNDTWISGLEWDRLGSRILAYKCLWTW